jgi:hypothetical protein
MPELLKLYGGEPAPHTVEKCPNTGKLLFWPQLDGPHGDAHTLYCQLCGVAVRKEPYPEETRTHP